VHARFTWYGVRSARIREGPSSTKARIAEDEAARPGAAQTRQRGSAELPHGRHDCIPREQSSRCARADDANGDDGVIGVVPLAARAAAASRWRCSGADKHGIVFRMSGRSEISLREPHPVLPEATAIAARVEQARFHRRLQRAYSRPGDALPGRHRSGSGGAAEGWDRLIRRSSSDIRCIVDARADLNAGNKLSE
jgi:hypothetical protein